MADQRILEFIEQQQDEILGLDPNPFDFSRLSFTSTRHPPNHMNIGQSYVENSPSPQDPQLLCLFSDGQIGPLDPSRANMNATTSCPRHLDSSGVNNQNIPQFWRTSMAEIFHLILARSDQLDPESQMLRSHLSLLHYISTPTVEHHVGSCVVDITQPFFNLPTPLETFQANSASAGRNIPPPGFLRNLYSLVLDIPQLHFNLPRRRETFHANSASAAQLDPESGWHPSYPDGVFNQRAPSLHGTNATIINIPGDLSSVSSEDAEHLSLNSARVEGQQLSDQPGLKEKLLGISAQAGLAMVTIWTGTNNSLSQHEENQFFIAAAFNVAGFLILFFAILQRDKNTRLTKKLTAIGIGLAAFGFLAIMGLLLNDNIMLWVTGLACLVCIPAFIWRLL